MTLSAIILDQWVPGDQACELIAELKDRRPALPILMLTTSTSPLLAVEAMRAGATDYLVKPVAPDRMMLAVRTYHHPRGATGRVDPADREDGLGAGVVPSSLETPNGEAHRVGQGIPLYGRQASGARNSPPRASFPHFRCNGFGRRGHYR
jgi:DNA-binding response OmpR family regulator